VITAISESRALLSLLIQLALLFTAQQPAAARRSPTPPHPRRQVATWTCAPLICASPSSTIVGSFLFVKRAHAIQWPLSCTSSFSVDAQTRYAAQCRAATSSVPKVGRFETFPLGPSGRPSLSTRHKRRAGLRLYLGASP